jgi:transposase-like protein
MLVKSNADIAPATRLRDHALGRQTEHQWRPYKHLPSLGYKHSRVNHSAGEYVDGIHHTNTLEGFWSHLKRGISSTHVSVSKIHLQKYVDEFAFRFNNRDEPAAMFHRMLRQVSRAD